VLFRSIYPELGEAQRVEVVAAIASFVA
jgi:hypothetical protein